MRISAILGVMCLVERLLGAPRVAPLRRGLLQALGILILSAAAALAYNRTRPVPLPLFTDGASAPAPAPGPGADPAAPGDAGATDPGAGQAVAGQDEPPVVAGPREIRAEELAASLGDGMTLVLDARDPEYYAEGHLPEAVNLPYNQFETRVIEVSARMFPEQRIVCYCEGGACEMSHDLARDLFAMGYTNVFVLAGGLELWIEQGNEVVVP